MKSEKRRHAGLGGSRAICPVPVSIAALLRFLCAFPCQEKASNAAARPLIRKPFSKAGSALDRPQAAWLPGTPGPLSRTGGAPPFTQPREFCARSASGHRPHVGGDAFRCIPGGTRRSMARVLRVGICGDDFLRTYQIARRMAAPTLKTVTWLHAVLTMHAGGHRFSPQCNGSYLRLHTIAISSNLV